MADLTDRRLSDIDDILSPSRVVLFPVRHHSPAAARLVRELIRRSRPAAVLIEGPADFNDHLDELSLDHALPIAIYSYTRLPDGSRRGAYYPFCDYSPEWQAIRAAREIGAEVRFIDLPFADVARDDAHTNRYADADLRRGQYVQMVCRRLGIEGFDALWDALFETEAGLTVDEYLRRAHHLCSHIRLLEGAGRSSDLQREAFMAAQIRATLGRTEGLVVVVTGGYHSIALHHRLAGRSTIEGLLEPADAAPPAPEENAERGVALTPYSYERLDSLRGYEAGMPNPGFYDLAWDACERKLPNLHRRVLAQVARVLRDRKQRVSSADLIAAEACARGLARLRGRNDPWRTDLLDGVLGALVKDELATKTPHPLLEALHEILRGDKLGRLADGTSLPPLVRELRRQLEAAGLSPQNKRRPAELDLMREPDRVASRLLHRVRLLGIAGYQRTGGTDFTSREDLSRLWEQWELQWTPDFDATAVEASRYGSTVEDAATARLVEQAKLIERSAKDGAALLVDAALAGLNAVAGELHQRVAELVRQDPGFLSLTQALGHLLYLYRYDEVLGTTGRADLGAVLGDAFARALWLLETLGQVTDGVAQVIKGVARLIETFERCDPSLGLNRAEVIDVFGRVRRDRGQSAAVRGAAVGALWRLGKCDADEVEADLRLFADPDQLGDFLTGLFLLAREWVQRHPSLILALDGLLRAFADDQFLTALPSLRLAFTYFTPREKHHLALNLKDALKAGGTADVPSLALVPLEVSPAQAARAMALEARLAAAVKRYGLRPIDLPASGGAA